MSLPGEPQRPRIRLRFTALYAATLLFVLLGAAGTLRYALRATLQREFDKSVHASAGLVQQFFRVEIEEYLTVEATLAHIAGELVFEDRAIRLRKPDGALFKTVGAPVRRARRPLPGPVRTVRFALDPELAPKWDIEVDASEANVMALQARIDRWFGVGIPLLVLCAAVAGWWLTGRTLRPVVRMADAAARIAPASGARLPIDDPTDELGRLGLRFNAVLDRLDGALAQQREFLADAAHELRTPIARLRARVEVAMLAPSAPNDTTVLRAIDQELRDVSQHVDELLQLARADAAGEEAAIRAESLFLDDIVADELPRWQPEAQRRDMTLDYSLLEESPVLGDASLLPRLVSILVDNAIRYGKDRGTVRVRVRPDNGAALLDVEDDGIGIPPHERTRVFDRFYRGDAARIKRPDGSGLGLAIAAWIVRQHHGTIAVSTVAGGGTLVQVRVPLATN
ncbi:sensor histidine kinase [Gemmatimonas sp.]|uniref:sensor histidine kinase n=1 Tax=Gemmatimonas sp. TaxID=1962908 RepID=UPI0035654A65